MTATLAEAIGGYIKDLRQKAKMTQSELAARVGTHRPLVARIEAGQHVPTIETIVLYARALGVEPSRILALADDFGPADPKR